MRRSPLFLLPFLTAGPGIALAQIEEIVVTAQGREESLRAAPATITAFTGAEIARARLQSLDDLGQATPGVFVINDQDPGTNIITIRGVSTDRLQAPSVAYVVDGVPLADTELFTARLFDIEQIEVLKGPQGALYGRNAAGGVIDIVTAAAPDRWTGGASAEFGNGATEQYRAQIGGPLGTDKLRARVSAFTYDTDGFIDNSFLGLETDFFQSRGLRARIEAEPAADLDIELIVSLLDEDGGAAFISSNNVVGDFAGRLDGAALTDPFGDFPGRSDRSWFHAALKAEWAVGPGTVSALAARDSYEKDFIEELDFRNDAPLTLNGVPLFPTGVQPIAQPVDLEIWTGELRYTSDQDRRWRWTVGAFVQDLLRVRVDDFGPLLFGAEAPRSAIDSLQYAVFGALDVDLTETVQARVSLRYDADEREEVLSGVDSGALLRASADVFDEFQPKLTLRWRPDDRVTAYASYAEGFKTGAFNPEPGPLAEFAEDVPPETTRGVEFGLKTAWFDSRLQADAAFFATWIDDYQNFNFINGQSVILSAERVRIRGWEAALAGQPLAGLTLRAGATGNDAEIVDFRVPDPFGGPVPLDFSGNQVPNSPRWQLNLTADYERPLPAGLRLNLRLDYAHQGRVNYQPDNVLFSPDHGFLDGRIALSRARWSLALWAENITDERRAISAFSQTLVPLLAGLGPGGPFDSFTLNRPRRWGVTLEARF